MFFLALFKLFPVFGRTVKIDADSIREKYLDVQQQPEIQKLLKAYEKQVHYKDFIDSKRFDSYKLDFISNEEFYFIVERKLQRKQSS